MPVAVAIFLALLLVSGICVGTGWGMVFRLTPESKQREILRWLRNWSIKGLLLPLAIWALMNIGLSWNLQAFMPQVQAAQNKGGPWFPAFLRVFSTGMFIVSSYWAAVTLSWLLIRAGSRLEGEPRSDFRALCCTCGIAMLLPGIGLFLLGGWSMVGLAVIAMLAPVAGYAPAILQIQKMPPMYARAVAKMKFGKYTEAEWEIIRELEKSEDDFEGWMMMAELYANHFRDLSEAEQTVLEICDQPATTVSQLSIALHKLADWQLKYASDPEAARRALQMICARAHGTHLAHMAQLRINQLPVTREDLREQRTAYSIPLPALGDTLDEGPESADTAVERRKAAEQANACVEKLKLDPNNAEAREKLARLFAEHLNNPALGIEQLELLLDMPDQEDARRAQWLGLIAAWQIKYQHDSENARKILERLIGEYPHSVQAFAARRRIELMDRAAQAVGTGVKSIKAANRAA